MTMFKLSKDIPDQIRKSPELPNIVALSFFSGAIVLDYGIEKAGIHPVLASEIEPNARKTILLNRPNIGLIGDINNYSAKDIRKFAPNHFLLVPGVGAQGGSLQEVSKYGLIKDCGLIVNSSRGIIYASNNEDFAEAARLEALAVKQ